ncbi:hypothetical protein KKD70_03040, partial [Patescibacteria group bacterium]|nr:hypothetical protein [Patescibacteria group bacterium]
YDPDETVTWKVGGSDDSQEETWITQIGYVYASCGIENLYGINLTAESSIGNIIGIDIYGVDNVGYEFGCEKVNPEKSSSFSVKCFTSWSDHQAVRVYHTTGQTPRIYGYYDLK